MSTDIFAPDHNDPFAVTFIHKKLKAGATFTYIKNGEIKGSIRRLARASGRLKSGEVGDVVVPGYYSMTFGSGNFGNGYFGGETFTTGECARFKITKNCNGFEVSLNTLQR